MTAWRGPAGFIIITAHVFPHFSVDSYTYTCLSYFSAPGRMCFYLYSGMCIWNTPLLTASDEFLCTNRICARIRPLAITNVYELPIRTGLTPNQAKQLKKIIISRQLRVTFMFEVYVQLMSLYIKWEKSRLVESISSNNILGTFEFHGSLSTWFSLACVWWLSRRCIELHHINCTKTQ